MGMDIWLAPVVFLPSSQATNKHAIWEVLGWFLLQYFFFLTFLFQFEFLSFTLACRRLIHTVNTHHHPIHTFNKEDTRTVRKDTINQRMSKKWLPITHWANFLCTTTCLDTNAFSLYSPPPQVIYAPPPYQYQNDNTCCWAWYVVGFSFSIVFDHKSYSLNLKLGCHVFLLRNWGALLTGHGPDSFVSLLYETRLNFVVGIIFIVHHIWQLPLYEARREIESSVIFPWSFLLFLWSQAILHKHSMIILRMPVKKKMWSFLAKCVI